MTTPPLHLEDIIVPAPTQEDLDWSTNLVRKSKPRLYKAIKDGALWRIYHLIKDVGMNINEDDFEALYLACKSKNSETLALICSLGADVSAEDEFALIVCAEEKWAHGIEILLDHGAKLDDALTQISNTSAEHHFLKEYISPWTPYKKMIVHHTQKQTVQDIPRTITRSFNFHARHIMTTITTDHGISAPFIEQFSAQDSFDEIIEAHAELAKHNKDLPPISVYTGIALKQNVKKLL